MRRGLLLESAPRAINKIGLSMTALILSPAPMTHLHPCPLCPECGRGEAAQTECVGACSTCVLDAAEDAVLSGKLWAHEEGE